MKKDIFITIIAIILCTILFTVIKLSNSNKDKAIKETVIVQKMENLKYGFQIDSFKIENKILQSRENLSIILSKYDISSKKIDVLAKQSKDIFDLRKMKKGQNYALIFEKKNLDTPQHFVYEISKKQYVTFELKDSLNVELKEKKTSKIKRVASGIIDKSLWESMKQENINPILSIELSEIYAWSIDFFRLKDGDYFKIIYEEEIIENTGEIVGVGEIKACEFFHKGESFFGFSYLQDDIESFFDENGKSLKKAFLKAPIKFASVTSGYSKRRYHPVLKRWKAHLGTDYGAPRGTPILATGDGVIIKRAYSKTNGNYVKIKHSDMYQTQYLHMSKFVKNLKKGSPVRQGQVIGYVGSTGLATGPHVCYRFWKNGKQVDCRRQKFPKVKEIKKEDKNDFMQKKDKMMKELENMEINLLSLH